MKSLLQGILATTSLLASTSSLYAAAGDCGHPYQKVFPYQFPIGTDRATLLFENDVRVEYDCTSFLAQSDAKASLGFLELDLEILNAQAVLKSPHAQDAEAGARLMFLGYEVGHRNIDLSELVDISLDAPVDLDVAGELTIQVGPVPVPVKYGVEGHAALRLTGGLKDLGVDLKLTPSVDSRAYVQTAIDVGYAKAVASGQMLVLRDRLESDIHVAFDDREKLYVRYDLEGRNKLRAFDGQVKLFAQGKIGKYEPSFEKQLFQWQGYDRDDVILQFSDRIELD